MGSWRGGGGRRGGGHVDSSGYSCDNTASAVEPQAGKGSVRKLAQTAHVSVRVRVWGCVGLWWWWEGGWVRGGAGGLAVVA
jgi:hypothetical protein